VRTIEGIQNDYPYKNLKIMASGVVFVSGITTASSTVYFLPEAKSAGVASSDKNALMFLGMDRDVNLKGYASR
jgi:hypothetical protein